jgi:hypothetical protein
MISKKLVSGLTVILLSLNFAAYAIENESEDLNLAHNSNETSNEQYLDSSVNKPCSCDVSGCVDIDLENIIQDVSYEYFSEGYSKYFEYLDNIEDFECKMEMDEVSNCTKICLCKKIFQILEIWRSIFSKLDKNEKKGNKAVIDGNLNTKPLIKDLRNIFLGFLCKFFLVDSSKSLEDSDCVKSCGCKMLKNKDYDCTEIYVCKEHSHVLETWGERVLKLTEDSGKDADSETISDPCGCEIATDSCGCQTIYICEKHLLDLETLGNGIYEEEDIELEDIKLENIQIWDN